METDLLGDPIDYRHAPPGIKGRGRNGRGKQAGYIAAPGTGPAGETCGSCAHIARSKKFRKCLLLERKWTHGFKTDILARSPACSKWSAVNPQGKQE